MDTLATFSCYKQLVALHEIILFFLFHAKTFDGTIWKFENCKRFYCEIKNIYRDGLSYQVNTIQYNTIQYNTNTSNIGLETLRG